MFFNFFSKKKDSTELTLQDDNILARISYIVFKDSSSPLVDVELEDYNDECISAMCNILEVLSQDKAFIETINIIKNAIIDDGHEEYLYKIFANLSHNVKAKILDKNKITEKNIPCIKPSDIFHR